MNDLPDFDLVKGSGDEVSEPPPSVLEPPPRMAWWIGGATAALLALGGGGYLLFLRSAQKAPRIDVAAPGEMPAAAAPGPSPLDLRPLDESDAMVRELAKELSKDSRFAEWLTAKDLIRRLVGAVVEVAAGESPRSPLGFLAPTGSFVALQTPSRIVIDRRSYARYDGVAAVVASLDAAACARVFRQLQPLFDAAYAELGREDRLSVTLERAVRLLLETPVPEGDVALRHAAKPALAYEYVDSKLEALTPAQKHMVRLGPENARKVKLKLRELLQALGLDEPGPADGVRSGAD